MSETLRRDPAQTGQINAGQTAADNADRRLLALQFLWLIYVAGLVGSALWFTADPRRWELVRWGPASDVWIISVAIQLGLQVAGQFLAFLLMAFLTAAAMTQGRSDLPRYRFLLACSVSFAISLASSIGLKMLANGQPIVAPSFPALVLLTLSCGWGTWLGASWVRAKSFFGWLATQMMTSFAGSILVACALIWMVLSSAPLQITRQTVSTDDRRHLVELFREQDSRHVDGETTEFRVTELELNQLASWGVSLLPGEQRADFVLGQGKLSLRASFQLPLEFLPHRYLNLTVTGRPIVGGGAIGLLPEALSLGRLEIPQTLLAGAGPMLLGHQWHNKTTEPFLTSLQSIQLRDQTIAITYHPFDLQMGSVSKLLVGLGLLENLEPATTAQVANLIEFARQQPNLTFAQCIEEAFAQASRRSVPGAAAHENRAAILALGYVLGHRHVRTIIGDGIPVPPGNVRARFWRVTLRGRHDWTKHYTISAAMQVLSNTLTSQNVGVLKEELDADGGSGFSFGDLLADRAGTMLAVRATESEAGAVEIQRRIAAGFCLSDFMPEAEDLPEGLSKEEFAAEFGGINGQNFQRMVADIDRRIENCAAYKRSSSN